jgi:hypothetical protein
MNNFESSLPKDDFYQLKIAELFLKGRKCKSITDRRTYRRAADKRAIRKLTSAFRSGEVINSKMKITVYHAYPIFGLKNRKQDHTFFGLIYH